MKAQSSVAHLEVSKLSAGANVAAIVPTTIEQAFRLAELIYQSGLSPYQLKSPAAVTVVLLKGLEIGLPPMAALECIGVINGKACLHSDGIPSLLWSRGFKIKESYENEANLDDCIAVCAITRPEGDTYTFKYSAQDAKENGLWDTREKNAKGEPNKSPWYLFKKRMLRMRARGWLARDCAADVLKGIPIYEEQSDMKDITPVKQGVLAVPTDIDDGTAVDGAVTATVTEAEASQDGPLSNQDKYIENLADQLKEGTRDEFDETWTAHLGMESRLSTETQAAANALREEHIKRFETKPAAKKKPKGKDEGGELL